LPIKTLVTGASSGIGEAFAHELASRGHDVTLLARRENRLQDIMSSLAPGQHRTIVADLSKTTDVDRVCEDIANEKYDLLINNAGAGLYKKFQDADWPDIEALIQLNTTSLSRLSHQYLLNAKSGDALINVASIVGFTPYPPAAIYGATKAFVVSLSESLWQQYRDQGIYVMALCPGATDTEFFKESGADHKTRPPKFYMQSSEAVVATCLRALEKRKQPTVIPGLHNKIFYMLMRFLSRKSLVSAVGKYSARK
jgi:short-subunit dehydrogenase